MFFAQEDFEEYQPFHLAQDFELNQAALHLIFHQISLVVFLRPVHLEHQPHLIYQLLTKLLFVALKGLIQDNELSHANPFSKEFFVFY